VRDIQLASASFTPGGIADWYSPFQQSVMNTTADQMAHLNEQQRQGIVGNSISRGSWGGDRSAVAEALLAGEQQRAQAPVLAQLANSGFNSAAGLAAQRANMLQQGATGQLLQHLGMAAFHAGAFAGSHDDDVQRCSHIDLWDENRLIIDP
jgi:hypothetical protein